MFSTEHNLQNHSCFIPSFLAKASRLLSISKQDESFHLQIMFLVMKNAINIHFHHSRFQDFTSADEINKERTKAHFRATRDASRARKVVDHRFVPLQ